MAFYTMYCKGKYVWCLESSVSLNFPFPKLWCFLFQTWLNWVSGEHLWIGRLLGCVCVRPIQHTSCFFPSVLLQDCVISHYLWLRPWSGAQKMHNHQIICSSQSIFPCYYINPENTPTRQLLICRNYLFLSVAGEGGAGSSWKATWNSQ